MRGELTQNEGRGLTEQMAPSFCGRNAETIELAATGALDADPDRKSVVGLAGLPARHLDRRSGAHGSSRGT